MKIVIAALLALLALGCGMPTEPTMLISADCTTAPPASRLTAPAGTYTFGPNRTILRDGHRVEPSGQDWADIIKTERDHGVFIVQQGGNAWQGLDDDIWVSVGPINRVLTYEELHPASCPQTSIGGIY